MSKILSLDDMLEIARLSNMPGTDLMIKAVEGIATTFGHALAKHLGVEADAAAYFEHGTGGTCLSFGPPDDNPDMPVPYWMSLPCFDDPGEWEDEHGVEPPPADVTADEEALKEFKVSIPCPKCGKPCWMFDRTGVNCWACHMFFDSGVPEDPTLPVTDPAALEWLANLPDTTARDAAIKAGNGNVTNPG